MHPPNDTSMPEVLDTQTALPLPRERDANRCKWLVDFLRGYRQIAAWSVGGSP